MNRIHRFSSAFFLRSCWKFLCVLYLLLVGCFVLLILFFSFTGNVLFYSTLTSGCLVLFVLYVLSVGNFDLVCLLGRLHRTCSHILRMHDRQCHAASLPRAFCHMTSVCEGCKLEGTGICLATCCLFWVGGFDRVDRVSSRKISAWCFYAHNLEQKTGSFYTFFKRNRGVAGYLFEFSLLVSDRASLMEDGFVYIFIVRDTKLHRCVYSHPFMFSWVWVLPLTVTEYSLSGKDVQYAQDYSV